jgi:regulator of protease activity HflC (stomatin/prohibitin superfamily)
MEGVGAVFVILIVLFLLTSVYLSIFVVKEKEVIIIERLGKFHCQFNAGVHFVVPWIDWAKRYSFRYFAQNAAGITTVRELTNQTRISTQNEVLDFPRQNVISRDNAMIYLDAVLSYKIVSPKTMIYNSQNLPHMLSKLLQAQIRNVAGVLDVDQIIEDTAAMDRVSGMMDAAAVRWGVKVEFVKIQKVEAGSLEQVLAKKKQADLRNKEVIIAAKQDKQTKVIESEGHRDRMVREAEGEAQQMLSRARGQAQAIINQANAEARSVVEIARAVKRHGENPTRYLLALKYIEALKKITAKPETRIQFLPKQTMFLQTAADLGLNTILAGAQRAGRS